MGTDYLAAEAFISLFFLFWRFLYHGYIGHLARPVHITMKTKVVDTNLSMSLDQAVSIQPYSTYAIREWYTTSINPNAKCTILHILFQFFWHKPNSG